LAAGLGFSGLSIEMARGCSIIGAAAGFSSGVSAA
jgi:hypothetical protein